MNIADPTGEVVPLVAALGLCALGAAVNGGGQLLGQLFANGGEWSCVNLKKVGISAAVGCASGMAAPFMGSALGAAAFNGLANGVETLGHIGSDPAEAASYGALGSSVASGFVTGGLGGPAERPTNWWKSDNGVMNHAHSDDYVDIARENLSPAMSGLEFGGTALSTPNWGDGRKLNTEGCPCRR